MVAQFLFVTIIFLYKLDGFEFMKPGYSKMETYPYRICIHGVSELIILI